MRKGLMLWAMVCLAATAQAATPTIWRCGPDGTRFQAVPCHDGAAVALAPAPDAAAVREARNVAARERRALQALGQERRQRHREAAERGLGAAGIQPLPRPALPKVRTPKAEKPRTATPWVTPTPTPTPKTRPAA